MPTANFLHFLHNKKKESVVGHEISEEAMTHARHSNQFRPKSFSGYVQTFKVGKVTTSACVQQQHNTISTSECSCLS